MKTSKKITKTVLKTPPKTNPISSLKIKLKACDPEIQNYVNALVAENLKLHKKIAKQQVENVSLNSRIKVLEEEYAKYVHEHPHIEVTENETQELRKIAKLMAESAMKRENT